MLRKYMMGLLALLCSVACMGQSKAQVIEDIKFTMNDFTSALNGLCMAGVDVPGEIESIAENFKGEYFIFNGKKMESFGHWLEMYYGQCIQGKDVEHTLQIKEASFEKVDVDEDDDKRYRIRFILDRRIDDKPVIPREVSFVLTWRGRDQYLKIVEARGEWGVDVLDITKSDDKFWGFGINDIALYVVSMLFIIIGACVEDYAPKGKKIKEYIVWTLMVLGLVGLIIGIVKLDIIETSSEKLKKFNVIEKIEKEKIAWVQEDSLIGMADYRGNLILDYQFEQVGKFRDGLAWVWLKKRGGYVNTDGDVVVPPIYTYVHVFRDGIALVGNEKGYFIINTEGKIIRDLNIQDVETFNGGLAPFKRDDKYGYLSEWDYHEVIPPIYASASDFENGRAIVGQDDKKGVIDVNNNIIIPIEYFRITRKSEYFMVKKNNKYGLLDRDGNVVIPVKYDHMRFDIEGKATVYLNGKTSHIEYDKKEQ